MSAGLDGLSQGAGDGLEPEGEHVGDDEVEAPVHRFDAASVDVDFDLVEGGIGQAFPCGLPVDVEAEAAGRTEFPCGNGEDAGTAPCIEDGSPRGQVCVEEAERDAGRLVDAGAEGLSRVNANGDGPLEGWLLEDGSDGQAGTDGDPLVVVLPLVDPGIGVVVEGFDGEVGCEAAGREQGLPGFPM